MKKGHDVLLVSPANSTCSTAAPDSDGESEELDISEFVIVKRKKSRKTATKAHATISETVRTSTTQEKSAEPAVVISDTEAAAVQPLDDTLAIGKPAPATKPRTFATTMLVVLIFPVLVFLWIGLVALICAVVWTWMGSRVFVSFILVHAVVWSTFLGLSSMASVSRGGASKPSETIRPGDGAAL